VKQHIETDSLLKSNMQETVSSDLGKGNDAAMSRMEAIVLQITNAYGADRTLQFLYVVSAWFCDLLSLAFVVISSKIGCLSVMLLLGSSTGIQVP
jgi:hypothetical protein